MAPPQVCQQLSMRSRNKRSEGFLAPQEVSMEQVWQSPVVRFAVKAIRIAAILLG